MNWHDVLKEALFVLGALNVAVTLAIVINQGLSIRQKIGQALLVWLVPVLGGLLIGMFMWTQRGFVSPTGYPDEPRRDPADVYLGSHPPSPPANGGN
ncbi:hypothetical protein SAMN05216570_0140 [Dyella sp. OK004]|uniref:hypothetical protein n=1 Tax=Dyella sp. OK004 TaxID=1855292 RepID=UPI0008EF8A0D|nr:hypothetical protein [Dyella sp. OK004]SFR86825.1 hypothetical protein SAMN05216570_0140 [Dyella sp. OK004]